MPTLIADARRRAGWSAQTLARRLGVTPDQVRELESSEKDGTIRAADLERALEPMRLRLTAAPAGPEPVWPVAAARDPGGLPGAGPGTDAAWRRAAYRIRTAAIVYDAVAENADGTLAELWTLAEGVSVQGLGLAATHHVWDIAAAYDRALADARADTWEPVMTDRAGRPVEPDPGIGHPAARYWTWAAAAIYNGTDPREARYAANTALVRAGFDWTMLLFDACREYRDSVAVLRRMGSPRPFYELMFRLAEQQRGA